MPWVAAVGTAVGALGSAKIGETAASRVGDASAQATREGTALQREQWLREQEMQAPWLGAGENALSRLSSGIGIGEEGMGDAGYGELTRDYTAQDIENDPIYQQMMAQGLETGTQAIDRQMAARGGFDSGARLKALTKYGQGLASSEGMNAYNRLRSDRGGRLSALQSTAGLGRSATSALSRAGGDYASNVGRLGLSDAATQGNVGMTQANLWGSAAQGVGQSLGDYYQNQQRQQLARPSSAYGEGSSSMPYRNPYG